MLLNSPVSAQYSNSICWSSGNKNALIAKRRPKISRLDISKIKVQKSQFKFLTNINRMFNAVISDLDWLSSLQSAFHSPVYRDGARVVKHQHKSWGVWIQGSGTEVEIQHGFSEDGRTRAQTRNRKRRWGHTHTPHLKNVNTRYLFKKYHWSIIQFSLVINKQYNYDCKNET